MTTTTIVAGTLVRYHGSISQVHGLYRVVGTCTCPDCENVLDVWDIVARNHQAVPSTFPAPGPAPVRYVLDPAHTDSVRIRLRCTRPESFTPES